MNSFKDRIKTYYVTAREFVKQNNPKAARAYVLAILNYALQSYNEADTIVAKAKLSAFMDTWIAVSRDLFNVGISDYVLTCFGLQPKAEQQLPKLPPKPATPAKGGAQKPAPAKGDPQKPAAPKGKSPSLPPDASAKAAQVPTLPSYDGGINIAGLIDEDSMEQGWCAEVFDKNKYAVVQISASNGDSNSSGTGFVISDKGYLLTNDHVVFDEDNGRYHSKVKMSVFGEKRWHEVKVICSDKRADVALCEFDPSGVEPLMAVKRIEDYSTLKQGADCLIIGNAFGMGLAPFTGVVRFTRDNSGDLVYTAPSNPGDSGGPVFNRRGECIGINKSKTLSFNGTSADSYANATPMETINGLLKKWTDLNNIVL